MKKFFIGVICLTIIAMIGYGVAYVVRPLNSMELDEITYEVSIGCDDAFVVREESVYGAASAGTVYNTVSEGERISKNTVISTVYSGNIDMNMLRRLRTVDKKISALKKRESESTLYANDSTSVESEISSRMGEINSLYREGNIEQIRDYKNDINSLRAGEIPSVSEQIAAYETERNNIENSISVPKNDIVADIPGIFTSYTDGLETVLTPDNMRDFTPTDLRNISTSGVTHSSGTVTESGATICKVMSNHQWYIIGITDTEHAKLCEENGSVTIRLSNLSGSTASGTIVYLSDPDENNECTFIVEIPSYLESAFSYRNIDVDLIFDEYQGYKVPIEAVRTGESIDSYYVYATKGSDSYRCDIDILYTDNENEYVVIRSSEDAENNLSSMERITLGER